MPSVRIHRGARARAVRILAAADAAGWIKEYSVSAPEGNETRISFVLWDERRDVELPGIYSEQDETDFDVSDTDVDP